MAREKADITIDQAQLQKVLSKFQKMGGEIEKPLIEGIDMVSEAVVNHAKASHYFVGTGKGSAKKAMSGFWVYKNPDGTPRFKIRTHNLSRSILAKPAKVSGGKIEGKAVAGMEYARLVEEGGPGRGAFPFMRPAAEAVRPKATEIFMATIKEFVRRFGGKGG